MKLLTKAIEKKLPKLYETEKMKDSDVKVLVHYFHPFSDWDWYVIEYDAEKKLFYGLVKGFEKELGYFSLTEMENIKIHGLGIERDLYFQPITLDKLMKN